MKTILTVLLLLFSQLGFGQESKKARALNDAGSAILQLMQEYPDCNTRQNFYAAINYLEQAVAEDPENLEFSQNLGNCYYHWFLGLNAKSTTADLSDAQFMEIHEEMKTYASRAAYLLQKTTPKTSTETPGMQD
ncbi:MAG: hypothetical protein RLP15_08790 [Cryomorphaceae bacterium]